jgi:hypothetical protein
VVGRDLGFEVECKVLILFILPINRLYSQVPFADTSVSSYI